MLTALVIGIGHPFRRDDGIGPAVALAVGGQDHHGEGTDLMARFSGHDRVVLVDATASGAEPGLVRHWNVVAEPLPAGLFPKSSHVFGVAEAVELARRLGRLPSSLWVVGIEGADFSAGQGFSPAVQAAFPDAVALVRRLMAA